jgi:hypothetical protein
VHSLRPGDIDVVGAMGDSLTAGSASAAADLIEVIIENRGMSWSGGESNIILPARARTVVAVICFCLQVLYLRLRLKSYRFPLLTVYLLPWIAVRYRQFTLKPFTSDGLSCDMVVATVY